MKFSNHLSNDNNGIDNHEIIERNIARKLKSEIHRYQSALYSASLKLQEEKEKAKKAKHSNKKHKKKHKKQVKMLKQKILSLQSELNALEQSHAYELAITKQKATDYGARMALVAMMQFSEPREILVKKCTELACQSIANSDNE